MLHLSRLVGRPVRDGAGDAIGAIDDLIVSVPGSDPGDLLSVLTDISGVEVLSNEPAGD